MKTITTLLLTCAVIILGPSAFASPAPSYWENIPEPPLAYQSKMEQLAQLSGAQGDYFKLKQAESLLKKQDHMGAFRFAGKVNEPLFAFWKNTITAETYIAQNKPRQAMALLRHLPQKPDYRISFGDGLYANIYKRALITRYLAQKELGQNPQSEAAELVALFPLDEKIKLILADGDSQPALTALQKIDRLHTLYLRYKYKEIAGLLTVSDITSAALTKEERCRSLFELGHAIKNQTGFKGVAITALQTVVKDRCESELYPRALYWLGSIATAPTENIPDNKKASLNKLIKEFPGHKLEDDALYKLYKMAVGEGNTNDAEKYHDMLMGLKTGDMKSALVFEQGFPHYKNGNYKKAAAIFEEAIETEPTSDESHTRVLYWYARSLEKTGNSKDVLKAKKIYADLAASFPFSFYAILGAKRLNKTVTTPLIPREIEATPPEEEKEYFFLIEDFNKEGHHEGARAVLDFLLHKNPQLINNNITYITKCLIESQNYRKALDLATQELRVDVYGPVSGTNISPLFAALYPPAFKDAVQAAHQRTALPQGAIEGIMREESLFQRTAQSWVGATGLMQLMPATAAMLIKELSASQLSSDLTDPETNVLLGATYLRKMKDYFNGQLPLAIMAYNAGPGNVNKWLKRFGDLELDEFIENIPLSETRGYVVRVMRSMQVYGNLYHDPFFKDPSYFSLKITHKFQGVTNNTAAKKIKGKKKGRQRHRRRK
ncbi:MAG: transglycosylase SLT domain-containing protein [Deltaproteobacteria bacterium]|nr:transglycosylase SLT domain-containing protein [Deltaproteobacteria bacterium]